jgi:hypothetical protein
MGARLPSFPVQPSTLVRLEQEFTLSGSTGGNGWAIFQPLNMVCNDAAYGYFTSTPTQVPYFQNTTSANVTSVTSAGPYAHTAFQPVSAGGLGKGVRLVAWGVKILNITSILNRGGKIYFGQAQPSLGTSLLGTDETTLTKFPNYKNYSIGNDKWFYFHRKITSEEDMLYNYWNTTAGGNPWVYSDLQTISAESAPYFGMYYRGPAPGSTSGPESFTVKICGHFEVIGTNINDPGLGLTKADPTGLSNIVTGVSHASMKDDSTPDHTSGLPSEKQESVLTGLIHNGVLAAVPSLAKPLVHQGMDYIQDKLMNSGDFGF